MTSILFVIVKVYSNQIKCNYKRKKAFSKFFAMFPKSASIFVHFEKKKDDPHSLCISEVTDSERRG